MGFLMFTWTRDDRRKSFPVVVVVCTNPFAFKTKSPRLEKCREGGRECVRLSAGDFSARNKYLDLFSWKGWVDRFLGEEGGRGVRAAAWLEPWGGGV